MLYHLRFLAEKHKRPKDTNIQLMSFENPQWATYKTKYEKGLNIVSSLMFFLREKENYRKKGIVIFMFFGGQNGL